MKSQRYMEGTMDLDLRERSERVLYAREKTKRVK